MDASMYISINPAFCSKANVANVFEHFTYFADGKTVTTENDSLAEVIVEADGSFTKRVVFNYQPPKSP